MLANEALNGSEVGPARWPDWTDRTAVLIATGPSLTTEQIDEVRIAHQQRACVVVAINEAGLSRYSPLSAPFADVLYAADRAWWQHYLPDFYGWRISGEPVPGVVTIPLKMLERAEPMPKQPGSVVSGGHSGFQALGLALTLGCRRIALMGFDCGGKQRNAHLNRPDHFKRRVNMGDWIQHYRRVPKEFPDAEIYNCSLTSAIDCFQYKPIEDVLHVS